MYMWLKGDWNEKERERKRGEKEKDMKNWKFKWKQTNKKQVVENYYEILRFSYLWKMIKEQLIQLNVSEFFLKFTKYPIQFYFIP